MHCCDESRHDVVVVDESRHDAVVVEDLEACDEEEWVAEEHYFQAFFAPR